MKKITTVSMITLLSALVLTNACKKEEFSEDDAIQLINNNTMIADSMANAVFFTIKVVDASTDFSYKSASTTENLNGLGGATIIVKTHSSMDTAITGTDGSATFDNLRAGSYSVHIDVANYTSVDFIANAAVNGYFSVQIPVLSTVPANQMTVTGVVSYETDLLNTAPEVANGATVLVEPDIESFFNNVVGVSNFTFSGFTTSFTTDANGVYTASLPSDKAGKLTYDISVPTFEANQVLMLNTLNGVIANGPGNSAKTVTTRFGTSMTSATTIPIVNPVYCVFGAPTHAVNAAVLQAEIFNPKSFVSAHVNSSGKGYTDGARFTKVAPTGEVDAVFQIRTDNYGLNKVEYIDIISSGSGFANTTLNLAFQQQDPNWEVSSVSGGGAITGIDRISSGSIDGRGRFLTNNPNNFSLSVAGGTNASISISSFTATDLGFRINGFNVSNGGTGYTVGDKVSVSIVAENVTEATATGYLSNSLVTNIIVSNSGAGYPVNSVQPIKFSYGDATADAYIDNFGRVAQITVLGGSPNYVALPTVTIDYDLNNKTATADVDVQDGEVKSVVNLDGGKGYDLVPTLIFYSQYATGNPEIAVDTDVTINSASPYSVNSVTVNSSDGLISKNMSALDGTGVISNLKSVPGGKEYRNFYLGTGVRTAGE
ncbi:MAG: hypothetical protein WCX31_00470 [Salinivirgaceae bacterium]